MKNYLISYNFKGRGDVTIPANNKKEASRNFYKGKSWGPETEETHNLQINQIKKVENKS